VTDGRPVASSAPTIATNSKGLPLPLDQRAIVVPGSILATILNAVIGAVILLLVIGFLRRTA
jgi:Transglycosylase associated protein